MVIVTIELVDHRGLGWIHIREDKILAPVGYRGGRDSKSVIVTLDRWGIKIKFDENMHVKQTPMPCQKPVSPPKPHKLAFQPTIT